MDEMGKYIYGFMNSNTVLGFSVPENFTEVERCETDRVYAISYQDISAVVSDSKIVDYTRMPKDALASLLVKHQKVIERIMNGEVSIIPVKLGTFAQDETEVKDILKKGYSLTKDIFKKISDKIEIDVVATWSDLASVLKEIAEKEIKELRDKLLSNPKGITVDDQMKVGAMAKKHLDKKRDKYFLEIKTSLSRVSENIKVHEVMDDKMVANFAFLIDKTKQEEFDRIIEELNTKFDEKLNFRCVGPLPPYSFYTLEIKKMKFEELDWARRRLGLNDLIRRSEIKRAYYDSALSLHPDKNPDTPDIEKEFDDATKAYKILFDYCQEDKCSFKEEDFRKNSLIVKVKE